MIDLHIHSTFSDGTDNLEQIIEKANELKISHLSITDHNKCDAYLPENKAILKKFNGKIIIGTEIFTLFKEMPIDVLVYNFNVKKMKQFLDEHYPSYKEDKLIRLHKTLNILRKNGVKFDEDLLIKQMDGEKLMSEYVTENIMNYEENLKYFNGKKISKSEFLGNYISNPKSSFFINYNTIYPDLKTVISTTKKMGGITLLAHPFSYKFDVTKYLDELVNEYNFDGFECYHPAILKEQSDYLIKYCKNNNLLISGGSDYHGQNRENTLGKTINNKAIIEITNIKLQ